MSNPKYANYTLSPKDTENEFSSCPCGWCGSRLAGYRLDCDLLAVNLDTEKTEVVDEIGICVDCVEKEFCG